MSDEIIPAELPERFWTIPIAVTPVYTTPLPNEPIVLYQGPMQLRQSKRYAGAGALRMEWLPIPGVRFVAELDADSFLDYPKLEDSTLVCSGIDKEFEASISRSEAGKAFGDVLNASPNSECEVSSVVFHLVNFPPYRGLPVRNGTHVYTARAETVFGDWILTLDRVSSTEADNALRQQGGHLITHAGRFSKTDASSFKWSEAEDCLTELYFYFSFCRGMWTGPLLAVGMDASGKTVCEDWRCRTTTSLKEKPRWFASKVIRPVEATLPGFHKCWTDDLLREALWIAIHWYIEANTLSNVEGALVLAQAAIETLAWSIAAELKGAVGEDAFGPGKLTGADKMRLLMLCSDIPAAFPKDLVELEKFAKANNKTHPADAVTEIRNKITHPTRKSRQKLQTISDLCRYDALQFALWTVELSILRLMDYGGMYSNRLIRDVWSPHDVELVPWAPKPADKPSQKQESHSGESQNPENSGTGT